PGRVARLAPRAGRTRAARGADGRPPGGGARTARALRRALPLQGVEGTAGAVEAEADRADQEAYGLWGPRWSPIAPGFGVRVPEAEALGPRRRRGGGAGAGGARADARHRSVVRARAWRARLAGRAERRGQDDAARDDPRAPRAGGRPRAPRPRRPAGLLLAARGRARRAR